MGGYKGRARLTVKPEHVGAAPAVYRDGAGREWHIQAFSVADCNRLMGLVNAWAWTGRLDFLLRLVQVSVYEAEPGPKILLRRLAGLPDYTARLIASRLTLPELRAVADRIMDVNFMQSLAGYLASFEVKKKTGASAAQMSIFTRSSLGPCSTERERFRAICTRN